MRKVAGRLRAPRRGRAVIIVIVVVLVFAAGGGAAWWFLLRATPEKAVEAYIAAAKAGDQEQVKALMSSETVKLMEELEQQVPEAARVPGTAAAPSLGPAAATGFNVEVGKAEVQGDRATVPVKINLDGQNLPPGLPSSMERPVKLVREGGAWKIDLAEELTMAQQLLAAFGGSPEEMQERTADLREAMKKFAEGRAKAGPEGTAGAAGDLVAQGLAAKKAGQLEKAVGKLKAALAREPDNADAHWGLAWVLADQQKKQEAITHFKQVVELADDPQRKSDAQAAIERLQ